MTTLLSNTDIWGKFLKKLSSISPMVTWPLNWLSTSSETCLMIFCLLIVTYKNIVMLTINITASNILNVLKRYVSAFFRPIGLEDTGIKKPCPATIVRSWPMHGFQALYSNLLRTPCRPFVRPVMVFGKWRFTPCPFAGPIPRCIGPERVRRGKS
jgi:hypothetical protein